ncbi:MAG: three-Cys-motif partner protein TcmP, partial [Planctomycetia bacterium]|nr:three-Cys-motif partner protein TcmP [Planctomycetia bacterium]
WAADKLDRLGKYLSAYTTIMKDQSWCEGFYYIDAFAGPGEHEVRKKSDDQSHTKTNPLLDVASYGQSQEEQRQFLAGSPRVALDIEHPFTGYVFVDRSSARVAQLEMLKDEYGKSRKIRIRQQDCNGYLQKTVVSNPQVDWSCNRALVFLDPFGMQVSWSTLESLGRTKAIEVFLNFPVGMAIQRLLPRDTGKITDKRRAMLDEYFGSPDWFDVVYRTTRTLFGDEEEKIEQSGKRLVKWYQGRLRAAFGHVTKAALIRNTRRGHLYYLMLATPKPNAAKIANHILSAGETI